MLRFAGASETFAKIAISERIFGGRVAKEPQICLELADWDDENANDETLVFLWRYIRGGAWQLPCRKEEFNENDRNIIPCFQNCEKFNLSTLRKVYGFGSYFGIVTKSTICHKPFR